MKRLATAALALATGVGLLATHALGQSSVLSLSYPSTTTGCHATDTITSY